MWKNFWKEIMMTKELCEQCKYKKILPITGSVYCSKRELMIVSIYECKVREVRKDENT